MAEVAEERPKDCYAMITRSAKQGFAVWTLLTVWLAGTTTRSVEFEIATNAVLAAIRSNAPAHWSEEEINQDIEEVYDIRIDMMHKYPLRPDPAAGPDATTPTVRPLINRPRPCPHPPRTGLPHRPLRRAASPRPGALGRRSGLASSRLGRPTSTPKCRTSRGWKTTFKKRIRTRRP